jgi:electron transfer flavoprotein alpha subunit
VALTAGRQLASSWGATLYAAVILHDDSGGVGSDSEVQAIAAQKHDLDSIERRVSRVGADKLVVALTEAPIAPLWACLGTAWQAVLDHLRPRLVLFGADTPSAPELAPRTGARIGARLLSRARTLGGATAEREIELRDRDGGYVRIGDSGAAVALVGHAASRNASRHEEDIDVVMLTTHGGAEPALQLGELTAADPAQMSQPVVALGDDVGADRKLVTQAKKLAAMLGGRVISGKSSTAPLVTELCICVGSPRVEIAGAASMIKIGATGDKTDRGFDGTLPAPADVSLGSLLKHLEDL